MTEQVLEDDQIETNTETQGAQDAAPAEVIDDNDPMIASMKEAEAEIAGKAEGEGKEADATATAEPDPKATGGEGKDKAPVMIPKARFDDVLAERDRYRDSATFLQGVVNTQKEMIAGGIKPAADATGDGKGATTEAAPEATDHATLIAKAEDSKLALAAKYEDGEISLVEFEKQRIELDRQIRKHDEDRLKAIVEDTKKTTTDTIASLRRQDTIEEVAVQIQEQHPYIAEIDALPKAIAEAVWTEITNEAVQNLAKKGISVDGSIESHKALIAEKAALTNTYGPKYTGKTLASQAGQQPKPTRDERRAKLDLADTQPPASAGAGTTGAAAAELNDKDIESMSQDQLADALIANPHLVHKAVGMTATRR